MQKITDKEMQNTITIHHNNICTYSGDIACKFAYNPKLRALIDNLQSSHNKAWVYDYNAGEPILRAAQSSVDNAMEYMTNDDRVLIYVA